MARWALRYDEAGAIHLGYRVGHLKGDAQAYRAVVYDKAAYVLHMLRGVVGEAAFSRGLLAYLEAHRYSKAGADDLRRALEAASGRELSEYFRAWVYGTGVAQLAYRSRVEGPPSGYRVALEVEAAGLPGPVPVQVRIVHEKGETTGFVEVSAGATRASLEAPARPRRVQLNADRGLLARVKGG
jgi:aminopeptidase N